MPRLKKTTVKIVEEAPTVESTNGEQDVLSLAQKDVGGFTLVPVGSAGNNHTVEVCSPRVEWSGFVVCKRK